MKYCRVTEVEGEQVVQEVALERRGTRKDGRTVSEFNLLDKDTLIEEGYYPINDNIPEHDPEAQIIQFDRYVVNTKSVTAWYKVVDKPIEEELI